jgi:hypothetical protein
MADLRAVSEAGHKVIQQRVFGDLAHSEGEYQCSATYLSLHC